MKYYYRILDISPDSSLDKIKEQYHLLIFAWHPDRHPEKYKAQAEEKSKDINEAYKVLSDTERRKTYDMQLKAERARERSSPSASPDVKEEEECRQREEAQAARQYAEEMGATYRQSQVAKKLCEQGINKHNKKDYQAAIADYTQAIALDPQYGFAYHNRGRSRAALGEHQAAIADYAQAIALDPQYALAYTYHNRGLSYESLGDGKAAQVDYHKAADLYQQQGKISGDQYNLYRSKNSILRFLSSGSWSPGAYLYKAINKNNKLRNY